MTPLNLQTPARGFSTSLQQAMSNPPQFLQFGSMTPSQWLPGSSFIDQFMAPFNQQSSVHAFQSSYPNMAASNNPGIHCDPPPMNSHNTDFSTLLNITTGMQESFTSPPKKKPSPSASNRSKNRKAQTLAPIIESVEVEDFQLPSNVRLKRTRSTSKGKGVVQAAENSFCRMTKWRKLLKF